MVRCTRCNKAEKDIAKMLDVDGHPYGPECAVVAKETLERSGLRGDELVKLIQVEYKETQRQKTVLGMIKKGMFGDITTVEEFDQMKAREQAAKDQKKVDKVAKREAKKAAVAPVVDIQLETPKEEAVAVIPSKRRRDRSHR